MNNIFFNYTFNKGKLKTLLIWCMINIGQSKMINLAENLKSIGFMYATNAGISLGIDDLKTIRTKYKLIQNTYYQINDIEHFFESGKLNEVERSKFLIENWQKISEILKRDINKQFISINKLNPIYMMAFSGARGNISQVRQLIGMRGLMADPNGQIIQLPIKSNFREGLTVTEYLISCYGARKGVVDTALRTATAGYLTRRLVDSAQHVIISQLDCNTKKGIFLVDLYQGERIILNLEDQLFGRIVGKKISNKQETFILSRNQQIDKKLANKIVNYFKSVFVRSSLTCQSHNFSICQLCYGWNLSHSKLVCLGEVVGVLAAQSIGEPGTQLTMRTFHTGGVFSGSVESQIYAPFQGIIKYSTSLKGNIINTYKNILTFLVKKNGDLFLIPITKKFELKSFFETKKRYSNILPKKFEISPYTLLFVKNNEFVTFNQIIGQKSTRMTNDQQTEVKYTVNARLEGEIFFENKNNLKKLERKVWLLSGKIYKSPFLIKFFPKIGDFVSYKFPISQIKLLNTSSSFLRSLIIKKHLMSLNSSKLFNFEFSLRSEYPIYSVLIIKFKTIEFFNFFTLKPIITKEKEITIRLNITKKSLFKSFIPYISFCIQQNSFHYLNKLYQRNIFIKHNNRSNLFSQKLITSKESEITEYFLPDFYTKNNLILIYRSFLTLTKDEIISIIKHKNISRLESYKNILQNNFLKSSKFSIFSKENTLQLVRKSSYFLLQILISNSFQLFKKSKNFSVLFRTYKISLHPKTIERYLVNTTLIEFLNVNQNQFNLKAIGIYKIQIYNKLLSHKITSKKSVFSKINFLWGLLVITNTLYNECININFYSNLLILIINKLIRLSKKIKNRDNILLFEFFKIVFNNLLFINKYLNYRIFHISKLIGKYLLTFNYQFILNDLKKNWLLVNSYSFENKSIISNVFPLNFNKLLDNLKNLMFIENKKIYQQGLYLNDSSTNFLINYKSDTIISISTNLINLSIICNYICTSYIKNNLISLYKYNQINTQHYSIYIESTQLSKTFKEFSPLKYKIKFWRSSYILFYKKYFKVCRKSKMIDFSNFIFYKSRINKKLYSIFERTTNNKYILTFMNFNKIILNIFNQIKLQLPLLIYTSINIMEESTFVYDNDYKKRFINQSRNISTFLINERLNDLFFNNIYSSSINLLFSSELSSFKKQKITKLDYSTLYTNFSLRLFVKFPLLSPAIINKNSYKVKVIVKNNISIGRTIKVINKIVFINSVEEADEINGLNTKLKLMNFNMHNTSYKYQINRVDQFIRHDIDTIIGNDIKNSSFKFNHLRWISKWSSIIYFSFLSPYQGEIIDSRLIKYSSKLNIFNEIMFLTNDDSYCLTLLKNRDQKRLIKMLNNSLFINKPIKISLLPNIGSLINTSTVISPGKNTLYSGKILGSFNSELFIRKGYPLISSTHEIFYVWNTDFIQLESPIMTLSYKKLKTGDIVQGIPKIEHFFEARKTIKGNVNLLQTNLYLKLLILFSKFKRKLSLKRAVKRSLAKIQKIIIDGVCRVYCLQGIIISRKHFEIIVKQMTSKVKVIDGGKTGLLEGEFISLYKIEKINKNLLNKRVIYEPYLLGITKTSLQTESFISSASFQETTKVLTYAALEKRIDFLTGLKENVIIGKLIPSGTGLITTILINY
jgi:hypothetical protein